MLSEADSFLTEVMSFNRKFLGDSDADQNEFDQHQSRKKSQHKLKRIVGFFRETLGRGKHGKVYLTFGKPLFLDLYLEKMYPDWRQRSAQRTDGIPADWVRHVAKEVAFDTCADLNTIAPITKNSLVSTAILSYGGSSISRETLEFFVDVSIDLFDKLGITKEHSPFSKSDYLQGFTYVNQDRRANKSHGDKNSRSHEKYRRKSHAYFLSGINRLRSSLLRNNIMHHFIYPSVVAKALDKGRHTSAAEIAELAFHFIELHKNSRFSWWSIAKKSAVRQR